MLDVMNLPFNMLPLSFFLLPLFLPMRVNFVLNMKRKNETNLQGCIYLQYANKQ